MNRRSYLDHHAATPLTDIAATAMHAAALEAWANPASQHAAGRAARRHLELARQQVADSLHAEAADLVFTSGGSEACNLGIFGLSVPGCKRIVTSAIEHPAVLRAVEQLEQRGWSVVRLPVVQGVPPLVDQLEAVLSEGRCLVALQWVNHETGTVLPIESYAPIVQRYGSLFFLDATQAHGKLPVDVRSCGADALAIASHKLGGPAGAGALWVRRGLELEPQVVGGLQERGRRAGTPAVLDCVGFGAACTALPQRRQAIAELAPLQQKLERQMSQLGGVVNGAGGKRVPTVCNLSFAGWRGELLVAALDLAGICAASGAACSSGLAQPSPVLLAMHGDESWRASAALRLSFGPETEAGDLDNAVAHLQHALRRSAL